MTKAKRYQRYSAEFKGEAIQRSGEEGDTDRALCDEPGTGTRRFRRWRDELQRISGREIRASNGRLRYAGDSH